MLKLNLNSKAQASSVFRLLLGAVLGIGVLLIILTTLNYFQQQNLTMAQREFYNGFGIALQSPDGTVVKKESLGFENFTVSRYSLAKKFSIERECILFDGLKGSSIDIQQEYITIKRGRFDVYFKCMPGNSQTPAGSSSCEIFCIVSVGKKIE
ncbi:MAG: hypothetical protein J7L14_00120 [Candidatus Diapherotrites archaeon]|nr:hypothetical protein [Candidatus Diapherotrites archaeon]